MEAEQCSPQAASGIWFLSAAASFVVGGGPRAETEQGSNLNQHLGEDDVLLLVHSTLCCRPCAFRCGDSAWEAGVMSKTGVVKNWNEDKGFGFIGRGRDFSTLACDSA